jgi:hypothetical protein
MTRMITTSSLASLLAAVALAASPAAPDAPAPSGGAVAGDACATPAPSEAACGDAPLCTARERAELVCRLRDALAERYVFFPVKGTLAPGAEGEAPIDARAHLDACAAGERALAREDEPLAFLDRVRACVAAFEDGHLIPGSPERLPPVALGVGFRLAGDEVVVAFRDRALLEAAGRAGARGLEALAPGARLLAVDAVPAAARVDALARLVHGSSPAARRERAVDALGRRDFAYPARATATLTVAGPDGAPREVVLPWWTTPAAAKHPLARAWAARTRVATAEQLDARRDPAKDAWPGDAAAVEGARRTDPILPAAEAGGLATFTDDRGRIALRAGRVDRSGRSFCYVQLLTFHSEKLVRGGEARPFAEVVGDAVRGCAARGLDLVLDLRHNEGGFLSHSTALAAQLAPRGAALPGAALLMRASEQNRIVFSGRTRATGSALDPARVVAAIGDARRAQGPFTPAFPEGAIAAGEAGGYPGRIVALTSPACMSACDRLSALLARNRRATLVGGPTEGAGGSNQEGRGEATRWVAPGKRFSVNIPNAAMGVLPAGSTPGEASPERFFAEWAFENRPVVPDVAYATTADDLVRQNAGWLAAAEAALAAGEAAAGPADRS